MKEKYPNKFNWPKDEARGTIFFLEDYDFCGYCVYNVHFSDEQGYCGSPNQPWKDSEKRKIVHNKDEACADFIIKPPAGVDDIGQCQNCGNWMPENIIDCTCAKPVIGTICRNKK